MSNHLLSEIKLIRLKNRKCRSCAERYFSVGSVVLRRNRGAGVVFLLPPPSLPLLQSRFFGLVSFPTCTFLVSFHARNSCPVESSRTRWWMRLALPWKLSLTAGLGGIQTPSGRGTCTRNFQTIL